jgi:hypothetical protein
MGGMTDTVSVRISDDTPGDDCLSYPYTAEDVDMLCLYCNGIAGDLNTYTVEDFVSPAYNNRLVHELGVVATGVNG